MAGVTGNLLGQAYVRVKIDHSYIKDGLSAVRSMVLGSLGEMASVAGGVLAAAGIQSMTHSLAELGKQFIQTNDTLQQYRISLGLLFKSEQVASDMINQITVMAAKTPFRFDNLTQAVVQLKVFGFAAQDLMRTIRIVGDAASASPQGMADGVQRISYALAEMKSMGQIYTRQMNMLAMAGVPAWDILAKKMNTSLEDMHHQIHSGAIHADEAIPLLLEGIDERFGGMMKKQSRTWSGLMSTVKDNFMFAMRDIGKPFFDRANVRLASFTDWMDTSKFAEVKNQITGIVGRLSELADKKIDQAFAWLQSDDAGKFALRIEHIAARMLEIGSISFQNVMQFLRSDLVADVAAKFGEIAQWAAKIAGTKFIELTAWLNSDSAAKLAEQFRDVANTVLDLAKKFTSLAVGVVVMGRLAGAIKTIAAALVAADLAALLNPVGWLVLAIEGIGLAFIASKVEGEGFFDFLVEGFGRITSGAGDAEDAVSKLRRAMNAESNYGKQSQRLEDLRDAKASEEKAESLQKELEENQKIEAAAEASVRKARKAVQDANEDWRRQQSLPLNTMGQMGSGYVPQNRVPAGPRPKGETDADLKYREAELRNTQKRTQEIQSDLASAQRELAAEKRNQAFKNQKDALRESLAPAFQSLVEFGGRFAAAITGTPMSRAKGSLGDMSIADIPTRLGESYRSYERQLRTAPESMRDPATGRYFFEPKRRPEDKVLGPAAPASQGLQNLMFEQSTIDPKITDKTLRRWQPFVDKNPLPKPEVGFFGVADYAKHLQMALGKDDKAHGGKTTEEYLSELLTAWNNGVNVKNLKDIPELQAKFK